MGLPRAGAAPGRVQLIGGRWKRTRLPVPDLPGLRPTPGRVRETLFNWLGQDLTGWRCLDAFAGSGALGFEAASRGAAEVVMLERDPQLVAMLRRTRERLDAQIVHVESADALAWMARCLPARFELVLLDPPFDTGLLEPAIDAAAPLVAAGGWLYLEGRAPRRSMPAGYACWRRGRAGAVHFELLRREG